MSVDGITLLESLIRYAIAISVFGVATLFLGMLVPRKMNYRAFPFKPYAFEAEGRLYWRIRVHKWKDHIPDASKAIKQMTRKAISQKPDQQMLERLIQETCIAESTHWLLVLLCPVYSLFVPFWHGVAFSLIYAACNLPFIIAQRYNRPRLIHALEVYEKRERRKRERREKNENLDSRKE